MNVEFSKSVSIFSASRNPIVLIGSESFKNNKLNSIFYFIKALGIPFTSTISLVDFVQDTELLTTYIGQVGENGRIESNDFLNKCDCIIAIDFNDSDFPSTKWNMGRSRPIIWISEKSPDNTKHLNVCSQVDFSSEIFDFIQKNLRPRAYALPPFIFPSV